MGSGPTSSSTGPIGTRGARLGREVSAARLVCPVRLGCPVRQRRVADQGGCKRGVQSAEIAHAIRCAHLPPTHPRFAHSRLGPSFRAGITAMQRKHDLNKIGSRESGSKQGNSEARGMHEERPRREAARCEARGSRPPRQPSLAGPCRAPAQGGCLRPPRYLARALVSSATGQSVRASPARAGSIPPNSNPNARSRAARLAGIVWRGRTCEPERRRLPSPAILLAARHTSHSRCSPHTERATPGLRQGAYPVVGRNSW